jgi:hypothetical protein
VVFRPLNFAVAGARWSYLGDDAPPIVRLFVRWMGIAIYGIIPFGALGVTIWLSHDVAFDVHHAFRPAAVDVLEGRSPYPPPTLEALSSRTEWVYLPFAVFMFLPFALVPPLVADLAATVFVTAAGAAALWLLGVRDRRCYGLALFTMPVLAGIQTANLTLPLGLALAVIWVTRSRRVAPGLVLAVTLATKLFFWPVLIWFVATRRSRAAAWAVGASALLIVGSWSVLGFAGARDYPEILRLLSAALETDSYTPFAVAYDLHAPEPLARAIGFALGAAVLVACWVLGRRGDDVRSFTLAIFAALLFTPIIWLHYFALLYVPVAIVHKRLSPLWLVPMGAWFYATGEGNGTTAQTALVLMNFAVLVALTLRASRPRVPIAA